jgi:cardiolipin synthase
MNVPRPPDRLHWYQRLRPRPQQGWTSGNRLELLENGEDYFPAVIEAVAAARYEVLIESFILFEDKVGLALKAALVAAARRGVEIDVLIDDYGSPDLSPEFVADLVHAGVRLRVFDPAPRLFGRYRTNLFRRMHRKIVVVDGDLAFVGGINFSADHLGDYGPEAKQDFALRIRGPLVADIQAFARSQLKHDRAVRRRPIVTPPPAGRGEAMFVVRDNGRHRDDIERQYRAAIRTARREVIIANAYFFPGYRLLQALRRAARRGVKVRLILQGQPDMKFVKVAAGLLHAHLLPAGVEIHEYCRRPLHGKVAVIDDAWATVGSSNLDPLSLALNLEANVITRDPALISELRSRLERLMAEDCQPADVRQLERRGWWHGVLSALAYHVARWFPSWVGWMPAHRPVMRPLHAEPTVPPPATPAEPRQAEHAG